MREPPADVVDLPRPGFVYAFRTSPHNAFSPRDTGRYAALAVLGVLDGDPPHRARLAVALLAGAWTARPPWEEVCRAPLLIKQRPGWIAQAAAYCVPDYFWTPAELGDCLLLGTDRANGAADEAEVARLFAPTPGEAGARLRLFDEIAEGEWRWANDRPAFEAELAQLKQRQEAERAAYQERVANRLSQLTWDRLLAETPLADWTSSPPFPPETFTAAARRTLHDTCRQLAALEPKPKKPAVRKLLRQCVVWFNGANEQAGFVIETEEREAICTVLEEMAYVAGHASLAGEVDEWREW